MYGIYNSASVTAAAKELFKEERAKKRVDGWFLARETGCDLGDSLKDLSKEMRAAKELEAIVPSFRLP